MSPTVTAMMVMTGLLSVNSEDIDAFQYRNVQALRRTWSSVATTPIVDLSENVGKKMLRLNLPFATQPSLDRAVIQRRANLDLRIASDFVLDAAVLNSSSNLRISLYFQSGGGWYTASADLTRNNWQPLVFNKESFEAEGSPGGWGAIERVRISVRDLPEGIRTPRDQVLLLRNIRYVWNDTVIVVAGQNSPERAVCEQAADRIQAMLSDSGVGSDRMLEETLSTGALGTRRLVIFPYNRLDDRTVKAVEDFVVQGGKVLVFHRLDGRLGSILGFTRGNAVEKVDHSQVSAIRFDADDIPDVPQFVAQRPWNIASAQPIPDTARTIGWWYDKSGAPTNHVAVMISNSAIYFSHIITGANPNQTKQMLIALIGKLRPEIWNEIAQYEVDRADLIGHCHSPAELEQFVRAQAGSNSEHRLNAANSSRQRAVELLEQGQAREAAEAARECRELRLGEYYMAQPSRPAEGRAFWDHAGTGAYPGDWNRSCEELAAANLNMIIPNMLHAGNAHFPSELQPHSSTFQQWGDQISQCLAAAHKHGIEVHLWRVNYNLQWADKEYIRKLREEGRLQVNVRGEPVDWLNPAHPENFKLELESLLEVVRKYEIDGLHLDYIRYPHHCCYSDFSRKMFEEQIGKPIQNWPEDCYSGVLRNAYIDWRASHITRLVEATSREARKLRPGIKISAAVFRDYPECRDEVGQDWGLWVRSGYLDFLCPMNRTTDDKEFVKWIVAQRKIVGGRIPIYSGIGAAARTNLPADRVVGQIVLARQYGLNGFVIYSLTEDSMSRLLPEFSQGATRERAEVLHRTDENR